MSSKKTSLYEEHIKLNAQMASFANYNMPMQYSSIKEEVNAVRNQVGIFDVSHMGEFIIQGPDAVVFADHLMTNDFANAGENKAVYSPLCRENGTVIDDHIAYKIRQDYVLLCVNALNIRKDWQWIEEQLKNLKYNCQIFNKSEEYSLLAVQGPKTEKVCKKMNLLATNEEFPYFSVKEKKDDKYGTYVMSRTGYTGEDGFEIFCSHELARHFWSTFLNIGVKPCGLVARDVLRMEVCFPLYGNELSDELTPLDSALKWTTKFNKKTFIGKEALSNYLPRYRLVKLSIDRGIPRPGYSITNITGDIIGKITSGTMSITLGKGICLALIDKEKFPKDKIFFVNIRGKNYQAQFHNKPFVKGGHK